VEIPFVDIHFLRYKIIFSTKPEHALKHISTNITVLVTLVNTYGNMVRIGGIERRRIF